MSDYLVNLARRSAGIAPVARPRSGPGPGPIAGMGRGVEQASPPSSVRSGSVTGTDSSATPGNLRSIRVEPSHDEAARAHGVAPLGPAVDSVARATRESEPTGLDEPRTLRIAEGAASVERGVDAPTTIASGKPVSTGTGPLSPIRTHAAIAGHAPDARRDPDPERNRPAVEPGRDHVTVELPLPASSDRARPTDTPWLTLIDPAVVPAPLGGPRTAIEDRGPGREVHVRIGTIEIHAESDTPAPMSPPPAAAPAVAAGSQGGFDEFVRLRTYAPWER